MSFWAAILAEAGRNKTLNPSGELAGNFANHNSATVTLVTTHARYGKQCYLVTTGGTNRGVNLTLEALANAIHYVTFYARKDSTALTGTLEVSLNGGTNYNAASIVSGALADSNSRWIRYGVQISAAQANGSVALIIRNSVNENFYIDAVQVEQNSYFTTYIDGDRAGLYRWAGLRHGSASTRDAQERGGGRERDLADDYGVYINPESDGMGMPDVALNFFEQALQPGALFKSEKLGLRALNLRATLSGTTYQNLQQRRDDFINIVKGNAKRGRQPVVLRYTGANTGKPVYAPFRYADGLKFGPPKGFVEELTARLVAENPFWYEDDNAVTSLTLQQSISTAAYGLRRVNGLWQGLGSGFNGNVNAIAEDKQRGRIYFGGAFTTANGVTVNRICYWNGLTFVAMGNGVGNFQVSTVKIAPNGDVWVGGSFTIVDGTASRNNIARWNVATNTWTHFGTIGTGQVTSIAIDPSGLIYAAGNFLNWNGDANQDYITLYNGSVWAAVGTSPFAANKYPAFNKSLYVDASGVLWAGDFTGSGSDSSKLRKYTGGAWTQVGVTQTSAENGIYCIDSDEGGNLIIAGLFTQINSLPANNIAAYNGASFVALGAGTNERIYCVSLAPDGLLFCVGNFSSAGGLSLADRVAIWNGYSWLHFDADLPGTPISYSILVSGDTVYWCFDATGTATASAQTNVTPVSTAETYPVLYFVGPTSGSAILQWLENQSTGDRLYFNLTCQAGETITIDLRPGRRQVVSDWRGLISDQPLAGSDFANFELLPDTNVLAAFATGTLTGAALLLHAQPTHLSVDGVA